MVKGHAQVKLLLSFKCFCSLFIYYSKNIPFEETHLKNPNISFTLYIF